MIKLFFPLNFFFEGIKVVCVFTICEDVVSLHKRTN